MEDERTVKCRNCEGEGLICDECQRPGIGPIRTLPEGDLCKECAEKIYDEETD